MDENVRVVTSGAELVEAIQAAGGVTIEVRECSVLTTQSRAEGIRYCRSLPSFCIEGYPELGGSAWAFTYETSSHALRFILNGFVR